LVEWGSVGVEPHTKEQEEAIRNAYTALQWRFPEIRDMTKQEASKCISEALAAIEKHVQEHYATIRRFGSDNAFENWEDFDHIDMMFLHDEF
jgi:hypothetical protein